MNSRWQNYGLWLALISFIALIPQALATYGIHWALPGNYNIVAVAFLQVFVLAGILNNPTSSLNLGFMDTEVVPSPWQNVRAWIAVFSFIALIPQVLGFYNLQFVLPSNYGDLTNGLLGILVLTGFLYVPVQNSLTMLFRKIIK
jgi:uncharacterized membrane protein